MQICICGNGDVTIAAAHDLIEDFTSGIDVDIIMPSKLGAVGLRNTSRALKDMGIYPVKIDRVKLLSEFLQAADDKVFMVLDPVTEPEMVAACWDHDIPVLDLTKGLWPVLSSHAPVRG